MDFLTAKSNIDDMEFIIKLVLEGKIKPVIDKSFRLNETADAIRYIKEQHAQGKVMIRVK
jgi:NADPH:quinone reductase-like Zn-dependent oxidoreductase